MAISEGSQQSRLASVVTGLCTVEGREGKSEGEGETGREVNTSFTLTHNSVPSKKEVGEEK